MLSLMIIPCSESNIFVNAVRGALSLQAQCKQLLSHGVPPHWLGAKSSGDVPRHSELSEWGCVAQHHCTCLRYAAAFL